MDRGSFTCLGAGVDRGPVGISVSRVASIARGVDIIRDKVRATIEGYHHRSDATSDQHRYYDGLYKNPDGTYTGIEVKGGTGSRDAAQRGFDSTVSLDRPATATLNGEKISITRVILKEVQ